MVENMINQEIERIEDDIKRARQLVEIGEYIEHLKNNRAFRKVILEGYFQDEAIRLVHLKGDSNMQSPESQASILRQMDAIAALSEFLTTQLQKASMAVKSIEYNEQTRDELLAEELGQ